jgi:mannose/fructose/N-acetylgalactosamine-specific phosphotransferase system component IID/mannose/fructose/N-acetylgalactosamine-specific phosphotransferase system component IIC
MENILLEAILLGIWAGIAAVDGVYHQTLLGRPVIGGAVAGLILGDLQTGLLVGGGVEMAYLVLVNVGGAAPPDATTAGIVAVAVGHYTGTTDVATLITASLPASIMGQQAWSLSWMFNTWTVHKMDAAAEEGNLKKAMRLHILMGTIPWFVLYFLVVFLNVFFGIELIQSVMDSLPEWVLGGLNVASGILPALGIAMLLGQIFTKVNWPWFVIGIVASSFLGLPVIGTALIGVSIAFVMYFASEVAKGAFAREESKEAKGILTQKDLNKMFWRTYAFPSGNAERHLAGSMLYVLGTATLPKLFKTKEEMSAAMKRHLMFYNVQPTLSALVMGSVAAMEEEIEEKDTIIAYKAGVMGPMAGIGDSIYWFTFRPIVMAIAASLAMTGSIAGPIVGLVLWNIINLGTKYWYLNAGYKRGLELMEQLRGGLIEKITKAAAVVGLMVMGTLAITFVSVKTTLAIPLPDADPLQVQPMLDGIMPGLLNIAVLLVLLRLVKKVNPSWLLLIIIAASILLRAIGVL